VTYYSRQVSTLNSLFSLLEFLASATSRPHQGLTPGSALEGSRLEDDAVCLRPLHPTSNPSMNAAKAVLSRPRRPPTPMNAASPERERCFARSPSRPRNVSRGGFVRGRVVRPSRIQMRIADRANKRLREPPSPLPSVRVDDSSTSSCASRRTMRGFFYKRSTCLGKRGRDRSLRFFFRSQSPLAHTFGTRSRSSGAQSTGPVVVARVRVYCPPVVRVTLNLLTRPS